ncbi:MAG: PhoH family protein [Bacteroidales bacterium]|nr:PhoH family protein [Bacteroidales bacterium]MBN2755651.1 PhoH family protein [Bacteroidales bacterium]
MIEKIIYLDEIDPINLYGVNNIKIEIIKSLFPELKIISRGHEIKVAGESDKIIDFETKLEKLINYFNKYHNLSAETIVDIVGNENSLSEIGFDDTTILYATNGKAIKARTANQQKFIDNYRTNDLLFAIGPAGTGKTYLAIALAVRALKSKHVKRIILSRPAVEAGEKLGFLPGDLKEKLDPYMQALYDALNDMITAKKLEEYMNKGVIQIAPLAFMRGRTLDNAIVILDEAQNASKNQLKMFLTRMGENSKFIVTGDITQIDLPDKNQSGLLQAKDILKNIKGITFVDFNASDVVRHKLVKNIIDAYDSINSKKD